MNKQEMKDFKKILDESLALFFQKNAPLTSSEKSYYSNFIAIKHKDGFILLEKGRIKTTFYSGYGINGRSSLDDFNKTNELACQISSDFSVFVQKNIDSLSVSETIRILKEHKNRVLVLSKNPINNDCYDLSVFWKFNDHLYGSANSLKDDSYEQPDQQTYDLIFKAFDYVISNFKIRLDSYLKKFGLSKVYSYTYLRD